MPKFREFYVPPGAGSNFLAGKCMWASDIKSHQHKSNDVSTNEFFYHREKVNNTTIEETLFSEDFTNEDLISETKEIKSILLELEINIPAHYSPLLRGFRTTIINSIEDLWRKDWSYYLIAFSNQFVIYDTALPEMTDKNTSSNLQTLFEAHYLYQEYRNRDKNTSSNLQILLEAHYIRKGLELKKYVYNKIRREAKQIQDYFIRCREYYFEVCESMNWNSSIITHLHPHIAISSQLKLPKNFKSLAMEIDGETNMVIGALGDIKANNYDPNKYIDKVGVQSGDNIKSVQLSDDSVSYRKIFIENNEDEIRKMYDFFDNEDCFEENKTNIMKEFKEYHDNNMIVIKDFMPLFYERIQ
tara:strand:+ start:545 stop:1615 length:1071 start_codon:yes stop_codon:yes gene_type:complete